MTLPRRAIHSLAILLLAAAGCDRAAPPAVNLKVDIIHGSAPTDSLPPLVVTAERVTIRNNLYAIDPCREVVGSVVQSGALITLRISLGELRPGCDLTPTHYRYRARIRNLAPGTYQLRVLHTLLPGEPPVVVMARRIEVPR